MTILFLDPNELERIRDNINSDPEFKLAARFFSKDILLVVGDSKCIVKVRDGVITEMVVNPTLMNPWSFYIKASEESWKKFLLPVPPPFYNALFAGMARKIFEVGGDLESAFAHYWPVARMLDVLRELQNK